MNRNFPDLVFRKGCCAEPTHFPDKMAKCEDMAHDIASRFGGPTSIDAVFTCCKNGVPPEVKGKKFYPPIYDHAAVQCTVNDVTMLAWNLEGLCDDAYNAHESRRRMAVARDVFDKHVFDKLENVPQVLLFQELFLRSNMPKANAETVAKETVRFLIGARFDKYNVYYDGFTGCTCVAKELGDQKPKFIPRPNDPTKKSTVVKAGDLYVVNVHLKAIQMSVRGTQLHLEEVGNILRNVQAEVAQCPVVFIGDHNTTNAQYLYMNAPNSRGGRKTRSRKK